MSILQTNNHPELVDRSLDATVFKAGVRAWGENFKQFADRRIAEYRAEQLRIRRQIGKPSPK